MGKCFSAALTALVATLLGGGAHAETSFMLTGERPVWSSSRKTSVSDIVASASAVLGSPCLDKISTSPELLAQTAQRLSAMADLPSVVIVFTGVADEKARTADSSVCEAITSIAATLAKRKAVGFIVPSQPTLGASVAGSLRVSAGQARLNFVEPGTEIMGRPYEDALGDIRKSLAEPTTPPVVPAASETSATASSPQPTPAATPVAVTTSATTATAVSAAAPLPEAPVRSFAGTDTATTATAKERATSHTVMTRAGATPMTINMASPPALKAFDPKGSLKVMKQGPKGKKRPAVER